MLKTSSPLADRALIAASRPEPGPLTNTSTDFNPLLLFQQPSVQHME